MEFPFDVARAFKVPSGMGVLVLDNDYVQQFNTMPPEDPAKHRFREVKHVTQTQKKQQQKYEALGKILDLMGYESAKAQGLGSAVTFAKCLEAHPSYRVYLLVKEKTVYGIVKVGVKTLWLHTGKNGGMKKYEPFCLLDFYIHENCQRSGFGKKLFEYMLNEEGANVEALAYDNPTKAMNSFLKRHYSLESSCDQVNNFVTLQGFFEANDQEGGAKDPKAVPRTVGLLEAGVQRRKYQVEEPEESIGYGYTGRNGQYVNPYALPQDDHAGGLAMEPADVGGYQPGELDDDVDDELPPLDNDLDLDGPAPRTTTQNYEADDDLEALAAEMRDMGVDDEEDIYGQLTQEDRDLLDAEYGHTSARQAPPSVRGGPSQIPLPRRRMSANNNDNNHTNMPTKQHASNHANTSAVNNGSNTRSMSRNSSHTGMSKSRSRDTLQQQQPPGVRQAQQQARVRAAQRKVQEQKQSAEAKRVGARDRASNYEVERQVQRVGGNGRVPMRQSAPQPQRGSAAARSMASRSNSMNNSNAIKRIPLNVSSTKQAIQRGGPKSNGGKMPHPNALVEAMNSGFLL